MQNSLMKLLGSKVGLIASVGLRPLEEAIAGRREAIKRSNEPPPADIKKRRAEQDAWARSVGWIK